MNAEIAEFISSGGIGWLVEQGLIRRPVVDLTARGTPRRLRRHPELRGLGWRSAAYRSQYTRWRRARLAAENLTARGTPRIYKTRKHISNL